MTTATEPRADARQEYLEERRRYTFGGGIEAQGCPECGHDSYVVTEAYPATRVDPACWEGHCVCHDTRGICDCKEGDACLECCTCSYDD